MRYQTLIKLPAGLGHIAASRLRDGMEELTAGCLDDGETLETELLSDHEVKVTLILNDELGRYSADMIREVLESVLYGALGPDATVEVGPFEQVDSPSPRMR